MPNIITYRRGDRQAEVEAEAIMELLTQERLHTGTVYTRDGCEIFIFYTT
jgi:hypothetical protein